MSHWLYQAALFVARPLVHLRLRWRARREPEYGRRIAERFGAVPAQVRAEPIWFHTVSAGETIAAAPMIRALVKQFPEQPFLVTTMTPTGSAQVLERLGDIVDHCYAPYDFKDAVKRFFEHVRPRALILMETELWPNIIATASQHDVPVVLVNARLSARSAKGYSRLRALTAGMLARVDHIACQTAEHRDRFIGLGASPPAVSVTGSVKYDVSLPQSFAADLAQLRERFAAFADDPIWIAASTHKGEDEVVLAAHKQLRERIPGVRLVLVPRHPVRCDDVHALAVEHEFSIARQSDPGAHDTEAEVVLGDVMGTLQLLYGLGRVAFVGGSLVDAGGHNPIEPALCGIPVVCGPFQYNFADVMHNMAQAGGLLTVTGADDLAQTVGDWLHHAEARQRAATAAGQVVEGNRGAQARVEAIIQARIERVCAGS